MDPGLVFSVLSMGTKERKKIIKGLKAILTRLLVTNLGVWYSFPYFRLLTTQNLYQRLSFVNLREFEGASFASVQMISRPWVYPFHHLVTRVNCMAVKLL